MILSETTLHSSIVLKGLNATARVSKLVSQVRPWMKILRWIGLESMVLVMCSMINGVFDVASLRIEMYHRLPLLLFLLLLLVLLLLVLIPHVILLLQILLRVVVVVGV